MRNSLLTKGKDLCLHLLVGSISGLRGASTSGCTPNTYHTLNALITVAANVFYFTFKQIQLFWYFTKTSTWSEIQQMLLFCIPVYWDGGPLNLQVFLLRHKELADFYVGTCWKQTPVCPGWMPGRAPALYKPPPPKWQKHWQGKITNGGLKQCVKVTTLKFGCTWILQGNMWETQMQKKKEKEKKVSVNVL